MKNVKIINDTGRLINLECQVYKEKIEVEKGNDRRKIYMESQVRYQDLEVLEKIKERKETISVSIPRHTLLDAGIAWLKSEFNGLNYDVEIWLRQR